MSYDRSAAATNLLADGFQVGGCLYLGAENLSWPRRAEGLLLRIIVSIRRFPKSTNPPPG